jgi:hypothetical protein
MISAKKWAASLLLITFLTTAIFVGLFNVLVDTQGIFKTHLQRMTTWPNENYLKMDYLLNNISDYDSLLIGSSRVSLIDANKILDGKYYNLSYSEGLPYEHLENLKLAIKNGAKIKNIVIGFDEFSYLPHMYHQNDDMRLPHYLSEISDRGFYEFFWHYLSLKPSYDRFKIIFNSDNVFDVDRIVTNGNIFLEHFEREIEEDIKKHSLDKKFLRPLLEYNPTHVDSTIKTIKKFMDFCKQNDIIVKFFINPIQKSTYLNTDLEYFHLFKRKLLEISDYYDFSGLNSITINNYNFYETLHYRPMIGDMIVNKIFGINKDIPNDFGILLTKNNINLLLSKEKDQHNQLLESLFDKEQYLKDNRDVAKHKIDPLVHYKKHGIREGRVFSVLPPN